MIKIQPFVATDSAQVRALLRHQDEPVPYESFCAEDKVMGTGLTFWQHFLPCSLHRHPSVYVAKEEGVVLGLISLDANGKSRACWRVNHLVVHPQHRGRGIAQELLRFALAFFGSQGVSHFIAEVSDQNSPGLGLVGSCAFRRCARVTYYQVPLGFEGINESPGSTTFRLARPEDKNKLFHLHRDLLPMEIRRIFDFIEEDYEIPELQVESVEKLTKRLLRKKTWYWVADEPQRNVIPCACKVTAHREGDYHLEFFVNPGWSHTAGELIDFVLRFMKRAGMKGMVIIKVYDFQKDVAEQLDASKLERLGTFSFLAYEKWQRAKKPKAVKEQSVGIPNLGGAAVNIPFAAEGASLIMDSKRLSEYRKMEGLDP